MLLDLLTIVEISSFEMTTGGFGSTFIMQIWLFILIKYYACGDADIGSMLFI